MRDEFLHTGRAPHAWYAWSFEMIMLSLTLGIVGTTAFYEWDRSMFGEALFLIISAVLLTSLIILYHRGPHQWPRHQKD